LTGYRVTEASLLAGCAKTPIEIVRVAT
jgi:hypothetical protein